jgi:hypothetical protein
MRAIAPLLSFVLFSAVLVACNIYLLVRPLESTPILPSNVPNSSNSNADIVSIENDSQELLFIHTQTRPLFSPTRRPWVAPTVPLEPVPAVAEQTVVEPPVVEEVQPPQISLLGIDITPSGAKALTLKTGSAEAVWVRKGEALDGWVVGIIESTSIELTSGTQTVKLELYPAPVTSQGTQP